MVTALTIVLFMGHQLVFQLETEFKNVDLTRPQYIDLTRDRIYILDVTLRQVHFWDRATGNHGGHFGREGEGPGEFTLHKGAGEVMCFKNKIMVLDESAARVHYFDADHKYLRTQPTPGYGRYRFWRTDEYLIAHRVSTSRGVQEVLIMDENLKVLEVVAEMPYKVHEWINEERYFFRPFANRYVAAGNQTHFFLAETHDNYVKVFKGNKAVRQFPISVVRKDLDPKRLDALLTNYGHRSNIKLEIDPKKGPYLSTIIVTGPYIIPVTINSSSGHVTGQAYSMEGVLKARVDIVLGEMVFFGGFDGRLLAMTYDEYDDFQLKLYQPVLKLEDQHP